MNLTTLSRYYPGTSVTSLGLSPIIISMPSPNPILMGISNYGVKSYHIGHVCGDGLIQTQGAVYALAAVVGADDRAVVGAILVVVSMLLSSVVCRLFTVYCCHLSTVVICLLLSSVYCCRQDAAASLKCQRK